MIRLGLLFAVVLGTVGAAQTIDPAKAPVRLDVIVATDRGERLDALRADDFKVTAGGEAIELSGVQFVDTRLLPKTPPADEITESSRLFAIVLDEYHVTPGPSADRVRDALVRFVREDLRPGDQVIVLKPLDSLVSVSLTSDREMAARIIEGFTPRRGDYRAVSTFEQEFIAGAPARIDVARAQIVTSLMNGVLTNFGRYEAGRKTLVLFSEGFVAVSGRSRGESSSTVPTMVAAANRARVAVYTLNPLVATPVAATPDANQVAPPISMLRALAEGTTGRYSDGSADPRLTLRSALDDASGYYVLTFAPHGEGDGRFHDVDVSVSRPRTQVRARRGYWLPSELERRTIMQPTSPFLSSFSSSLQRRTSVAIRPWFGMAPGEGGATNVNFAWEPAPRVPGDKNVLGVPARIVISVSTLDGDAVFNGTVVPASTSPGISDFPSRVSFATSATRLVVQMAIEDADAKVIDRDVRDVVVGGFTGAIGIGTAELLRIRTARERQALERDPLATPVSSRSFSRSEQLVLRVPVFRKGAPPTLTGSLVSSFGSVMRRVTATEMPSRPGVYEFDLPLASLAAGPYRFDILARGEDGEARESVSFRVTP